MAAAWLDLQPDTRFPKPIRWSSTATARKLGMSRRPLVTSPGYLARAGTSEKPADLAEHALAVGPPGWNAAGWVFTRDGRTVSIRAEGRLTSSVNKGATAAAAAGLGIVSTGHWGCQAELESGALVRVLPDRQMGSVEIHALFAAGRAAKPAARAFAEHLAAALKE